MNYPAACRGEFHPITIDAFVKIIKPDGTVKSFRCKARECLPSTGRLRNEAYIEVRRNDES
jgi:hypothetical protein